jgi:hypothetical protein
MYLFDETLFTLEYELTSEPIGFCCEASVRVEDPV